jgi:hypothetical protein
MLTGLKNRKFKIWLDGILWEYKWSFGAKKASIVKAIPMYDKEEYEMMNLISYEEVNVQSLMFRWENSL